MSNPYRIFKDAIAGNYTAVMTETVSVAPGKDKVEVVRSPADTKKIFEVGSRRSAEAASERARQK
ncbi:MAG: hypothetical protein ACRDPC_20250 [Solirubrobacteraceae bacterium]